jgi:hypothetical protein
VKTYENLPQLIGLFIIFWLSIGISKAETGECVTINTNGTIISNELKISWSIDIGSAPIVRVTNPKTQSSQVLVTDSMIIQQMSTSSDFYITAMGNGSEWKLSYTGNKSSSLTPTWQFNQNGKQNLLQCQRKNILQWKSKEAVETDIKSFDVKDIRILACNAETCSSIPQKKTVLLREYSGPICQDNYLTFNRNNFFKISTIS